MLYSNLNSVVARCRDYLANPTKFELILRLTSSPLAANNNRVRGIGSHARLFLICSENFSLLKVRYT